MKKEQETLASQYWQPRNSRNYYFFQEGLNPEDGIYRFDRESTKGLQALSDQRKILVSGGTRDEKG